MVEHASSNFNVYICIPASRKGSRRWAYPLPLKIFPVFHITFLLTSHWPELRVHLDAKEVRVIHCILVFSVCIFKFRSILLRIC